MNKFLLEPKEMLLHKHHLNNKNYSKIYNESLLNNENFWKKIAKRISWYHDFNTIKDVSFKKEDLHISWFKEGVLNASVNCIDRHLQKRASQTALICEADEEKQAEHISYKQLYEEVCILANALKDLGVKKGHRVTIYLPMIKEAVFAMLACARIGAVHSVIFGGFSSLAIATRLKDCKSHFVITVNEGQRGGKKIEYKNIIDEALKIKAVKVKTVLVIKHKNTNVFMNKERDIYYHEIKHKYEKICEPEQMKAEDPLFILYTSGSTGTPKGILHTTGGYMVYASFTHEMIFDYKEKDIYWCTADVGWITGHSYIVYGPLANGATTVIFAGMPTYPNPSRFWKIVEEHKVNILYTAPTVLRTLMKEGDEYVKPYNLSSLRVLGSVGEPINPKTWHWYYNYIGKQNCPIVDTWWQTETGGILISPQAYATKLKPGCASVPFFGIKPLLLDEKSKILTGKAEGDLCINNSWPGQMRGIYGNKKRFYETYFKTHENKYFSGDRAYRDEDGFYWIRGRVDDVMNISGHRISTAELESALVAHEAVAEAAVVSYAHPIKGEAIFAYVSLMKNVNIKKDLKEDLKSWLKEQIGSHAKPEIIQISPALPKTRSGKIMRRILREIANKNFENLGDISTLADSSVVEDIINVYKKENL